MTFSSEKRIVFWGQDGAEAVGAFFAAGLTCCELCAAAGEVISAARHQDVRGTVFKKLIIIVVVLKIHLCAAL
jgi:hypothetical protein